ncbi:hypothetical protein [uncultured Erythrobacter sp.]|uniref:lipopolysaccharide biosynthesis protein n=1 Tax=uncultured Erythrobacter sp. TaxID=263913 RepID=UPI00262BB39E|nr:hypothetical protein [uncultured Erythrobacter sp.]
MMNSRSAYVAIGLGVNVLMLVRGVAMMTALGYADLGLIALVQAAILFSGMLHFGLLNGGYRLLCHAGPKYKQRIIDLAYTGFAIIAGIIALVALAASIWLDSSLYRLIAALTALGGICSLLRAWMMNEMVAAGRLKAANLINGASMLVSLAVVALLFVNGVNADPALIAVASIAIQPVLFATLSLASGAVLRPKGLRYSKRLGGVVFRAGFTLFLTSIAIQFNSLIERTYVSSELGLEPLGRLYLAFLFLTLFQMAPNLVQQVFLPGIVRHWKAGEASATSRELRNLLGITLGYCTAAALALWLLAEPLLGLVLPKYVPDLRWVYLLAPGLIAFALSAPFALTYNVVIDYTWYIVAYGAGVVATLLTFGGALLVGETFSLDGVIILRSGIYALMAVLLVIGWWRLSRRHPAFRLFSPQLAANRASV